MFLRWIRQDKNRNFTYQEGVISADDAMTLNFQEHGARYFPQMAVALLAEFEAILTRPSIRAAGARLKNVSGLTSLLSMGSLIAGLAEQCIGREARPVRAILFDKVADMNWYLAWHQDRTICVKTRIDAVGFGPWTVKQDMQHVSPPFDSLSRMTTIRLHLDDVPEDNAPLLIAPGSHKLGRILEADIPEAVSKCGSFACTAKAGDIWAYSTPILHASEAAKGSSGRRVLQVDYSGDELPAGLEWLGI